MTYRRSRLLARALESLLRQELTDWVCELHNDDPADSFPRELASSIGDSRVTVVDHEVNLGPTRTFNLVFRDVPEPFVSMLEDDNWWEPDFLGKMIEVMHRYPAVSLAWANMYVWEEGEDGSWRNTGRTIWDRPESSEPELFSFPRLEQLGGALHSNGAMLVRTGGLGRFRVPEATTSAAIEPVRERALPSPLLFMPKPLANFAVTRSTSRSKDPSTWAHARAMLAASFLKHVPMSAQTVRSLWSVARTNTPRNTNDLLLGGLFFPGARFALRWARPGDFARLSASLLRRPRSSIRLLRRLAQEREVWRFLDEVTRQRVREAVQSGFVEFKLPQR